MPVDLANDYYDLSKHFQESPVNDTYTDWEGMTDPDDLVDEIAVIRSLPSEPPNSVMIKDLLLHLAFESRDQAEPLTAEQIWDEWAALSSILGARYFQKSGVDWTVK